MIKSYIKKLFRIIGPLHMKFQYFKYVVYGRFLSHCLQYTFARCGKNLQVNGYPIVQDPEKVYVGNNFTINSGAQICPRGKIYIGNNVTMSRGSQITAGELDTTEWRELRLKQTVPHTEKDVYIADGTWLCINAVVLPGVRITGKGVIVAAGAIVTKDIDEDFVIVGGIPAKIIKRL